METFKVIQFNIQFGKRWDDARPDDAPVDVDVAIEEIRRHDADIVLLQEVEEAQPGGVQIEPPPHYTRLRAALRDYDGYFSYPRADPRELPFGIGLAILSKSPLREPLRVELPSPPIEFEFGAGRTTPTDRLLIGAKTTLHGRTLRILNTHLLALFMLGSDSELHMGQRETVVEQLQAWDGPTVLGGDFNVPEVESLARQFAGAGFHAVQTREPTWRRRPYVLDHIFYNRHLRPVRHAVRPTPASDHHVVVAEFELADRAAGLQRQPAGRALQAS